MKPGQFVETAMSPKELATAMVVVDDQRFWFKRRWFWETAGWSGFYLKCSRCGDEMQARDPIEEEINHALQGCLGGLYEFIPPRT